MNRLLLTVIAALAVWTAAIGRAAAAEVAWATGPALKQRLAAPVDIVWSGNPLRQALRGLSRAEHLAILVDRRLDPEERLEVKLAAVPLAEALRQIAHSRQLGVAMLGPVAYFGPAEAAARLRTLAALREEEVRRLGPATARVFLQAKPFAWDDFATPGALFGRLAEEGGVEIDGLSQVPHDLWAAADLPPLPWVDRLTLVAIQFDLTFAVVPGGRRRVELVPLPETIALVRSYPGGPDPGVAAKRFAALAPGAEIKIEGDRVWVRGRLEDHERIAAPPAQSAEHDEPAVKRPNPAKVAAGRVVISRFAVQEKPVGKVLEQLAARLGFQLQMDADALRAAGISLDQRVSVQVENATLDDALRGLLRTTPLGYRRHGNVVEIVPK
ncbi:MAG: STN domain-containing protein [Thermoguttaceae bacterium]